MIQMLKESRQQKSQVTLGEKKTLKREFPLPRAWYRSAHQLHCQQNENTQTGTGLAPKL